MTHTLTPDTSPIALTEPMREKDRLLRQNIRTLGNLLGEVIIEQQGKELFELEETIRQTTKQLRRRPSETQLTNFRSLIREMAPETMAWILRAFTTYFQLVNTAEQHHRIQRLRAYKRLSKPKAPPGSLEETVQQLKREGVQAGDLERCFERLLVMPVFTAHPTEATRRTILEKHSRIWKLLEEFDRKDLLQEEHLALQQEIKRHITSLWQTEETRSFQITVLDELYNGLYYFQNVLYQTLPAFYRELERCLHNTYPGWSGRVPSFIRFGSWIGGDRDGNPHVTAEVTWKALQRKTRLILELYTSSIQNLFVERSESAQLIGVSEELLASVKRDEELLASLPGVVGVRNRHETYRVKLSQIYQKLQCRRTFTEGTFVESKYLYQSSAEFLHDLQVIDRSLRSNKGETIAEGALKDLIRLVETFGFHLTTLDIRQNSALHRSTVSEIAAQQALPYAEWSEDRRLEWLTGRISSPDTVAIDESSLSPASVEVLATLKTVKRSMYEIDTDAVRSYVVSMASGASDILEVLFLMKATGLLLVKKGGWISYLDIVPLFETIGDLQDAPKTMKRLYENHAYQLHLEARERRQEIMIGYSDSGKDGGIVRSHAELLATQRRLARLSRQWKVDWMFFHGRGGTVGRGGGPEYQAILSLPREAINDKIKITEQGEVLSLKYAHPAIAQRSLELTTSALLITSLGLQSRKVPKGEEDAWVDILKDIAHHAYARYRAIVYEYPGFVDYFTQATPVREIAQMNIGSRPAKRVETDRIEDLRAIPWVFGWMQSRHVLPGWLGAGTGIRAFLEAEGDARSKKKRRLALLRTMYNHWPPFRALLDNIQMTMAKADFGIARHYAGLVQPEELGETIFKELEQEFELTLAMILLVTGQKANLDNNPTLQRSIQLRNPYVDPMSYIQIEILQRLRAAEENGADRKSLEAVAFLSINGIAAGLRNTG